MLKALETVKLGSGEGFGWVGKLTQLRVQILICTLPHPPLIMNRISEAHILEQDLDRTQDRLTKQHVHLTGTHAQLEVSSSLGANINMYT